MHYWKRLSTGKYVDLGNMTIDDIDIEDIEKSLNYIIRFDGHWKDKPPLTVAQHTLLVANLANMIYEDEKITRACVLHDFGEAYYGDISSPIKWLMGKEVVKCLTGPIDKLIYQRFWRYVDPIDIEIEDAVKVCDLLALDIERRSMWSSQVGKDKWPATPPHVFSLFDKQQLFNEVADQKYINLGELL